MRQRFMDSIPWTTLLVGVGVGTALAVTPGTARADHRQSCYAGIVVVFDGAWHPGAVVGCRTVNVSDGNNVVGAEINLMIAQGTILSLIHISEPTRLSLVSRMPSSA